ncbi:MAG: triphosphoribosyl-dephospho-CoA synthase [Aigarchaeota archaeon]|nr:triphosphoribosyl-dephospho-CoA synthase [Aigarchaeota archaeon]MDW8092919.1 triphosphoribosyl-dephospho-CoA synthase [Nitrososphaerota archaeon]
MRANSDSRLSSRYIWVADQITSALILEASAYPKPALIDRYRGVPGTSFSDFVYSIIGLSRSFERAARAGGRMGLVGGEVGKLIQGSVDVMLGSQRGGNTHLGAIILLSPIAYVSGHLVRRGGTITVKEMRSALHRLIDSLDWRDAIGLFRAIARASPGGLGKVPFLDVKDTSTYRLIRTTRPRFIDVLRPYKGRDLVMDELLSGYSKTFDLCLPTLMRWMREGDFSEIGLVGAMIEVLSKVADTHITRRRGAASATIVRGLAEKLIDADPGDLRTFTRLLGELDAYMRSRDLRPGSTADLIDAALSVYLLTSRPLP